MICNLCPRRCNAERRSTYGGGFCQMPTTPHIARAALHHWEEPVISGRQGRGAVFFSGCALRCVFCQNHEISTDCFGEAVSVERLREIYAALIAQGAHNINLVTASHFAPWVVQSLSPALPVPVVWNCGGSESAEILSMLAGKVQVYLPDLKYADNDLAAKLSAAPDYFEVATAAIEEMHRQVGDVVIEDGLLKRGVVIRHLVLPGQLDNTRRVLDWVMVLPGIVCCDASFSSEEPSSASNSAASWLSVASSRPSAVLSNGRSNAAMKNTNTSVPIPMKSMRFAPGKCVSLKRVPRITMAAPHE